MVLALALGCGSDGFLDNPETAWGLSRLATEVADLEHPEPDFLLRAPSLAGCTVEIDDASGLQNSPGRDRYLQYDLRGRLVVAKWRQFTPDPSRATYVWRGDCLASEQLTEDQRAIYFAFDCDENDHWTGVTQYETFGPDLSVPEREESFEIEVDALGQLVVFDRVGVKGPAVGALSTAEILWDGQARMLQLSTVDLLLAVDVKRTFYWDHLRLLGFMDRGTATDLSLERRFERHRLAEEALFRDKGEDEEMELQRITWVYEGDEPWPISREYDAQNLFFSQDITVTCDPEEEG